MRAIFTGFDNPSVPTPQSTTAYAPLACRHWVIYCRVIDNYGDIGVCWRMAANLAYQGQRVSLVTDDASALAWMAPAGCTGVTVWRWADAEKVIAAAADLLRPEVVIEAFGCDPPAAHVQAWMRQQFAPVWINLEFLSAEAYVERSHTLLSPQANGLSKWFFFPGFTAQTGGLLREDDLPQRQATFDSTAWLQQLGVQARPGERLVSLFCYDNPRLPALLQRLAEQPTCLLLAPGPAQQRARMTQLPDLRTVALPWLTQVDYDHLLWSCALNFVRGEDSLVRAIWAGQALVWQAYVQHDDAHHAKLQALLHRWQPSPEVAAFGAWWNGLPTPSRIRPIPTLPELSPWQAGVKRLRGQLQEQPSLTQQLMDFVTARAAADAAGAH